MHRWLSHPWRQHQYHDAQMRRHILVGPQMTTAAAQQSETQWCDFTELVREYFFNDSWSLAKSYMFTHCMCESRCSQETTASFELIGNWIIHRSISVFCRGYLVLISTYIIQSFFMYFWQILGVGLLWYMAFWGDLMWRKADVNTTARASHMTYFRPRRHKRSRLLSNKLALMFSMIAEPKK